MGSLIQDLTLAGEHSRHILCNFTLKLRVLRRLILILLISFVPLHWLLAHPVHVSVCNFEISKGEMTVSVKLFSDDLALALEHRFRKKVDVAKLNQEPEKDIILGYITGELSIIINQKDTLKLEFSKSEENEGAVWLYFDVKYAGTIRRMTIMNSLLVDMFHDQTNLVIVYGQRQSGWLQV